VFGGDEGVGEDESRLGKRKVSSTRSEAKRGEEEAKELTQRETIEI